MNAPPHIPVCNKAVEVTHWLKCFYFVWILDFFRGGEKWVRLKSLCFAAEVGSMKAVNT